jgi:hypothetical protein
LNNEIESINLVETIELINLINGQDNPVLTEFFNIDVRGLDKFVKPETDILSLVVGESKRLEIVFVDEEKSLTLPSQEFKEQ